jgi:hypothetical protein
MAKDVRRIAELGARIHGGRGNIDTRFERLERLSGELEAARADFDRRLAELEGPEDGPAE